MKNSKHLLALALAMVLSCSVLASCSNDTAGNDAATDGTTAGDTATDEGGEKEAREVTASIQQSRYFPGVDMMKEKLLADENITLDVQTVPDDQYDNLIQMQTASGEAPDLIDYNAPHLYGTFDAASTLVDLSDEPWAAELVNPSVVTADDGKIYAFPFQSISGFYAMVYNKTAFETAGIEAVPTTPEEFAAACDALLAVDIDPIMMSSDGWCGQIWMTAGYAAALGTNEAGAEFDEMVFSNQKKMTDYTDILAPVIDDYLSLFERGYANEDHASTNHDACLERVGKGEAAMYFHNAVPTTSNILKAFPDADLGLFNYPAPYTQNDVLISNDSSVSFAVYKDSDNIDAAKDVLNLFATNDYGSLWFTEGNSGFPSFATTDGGEKMPAVQELYDNYVMTGKNVQEMNNRMFPVNPIVGGKLWIYYQEAIAKGDIDGATIIERFQGDIETYMSELQAPGF